MPSASGEPPLDETPLLAIVLHAHLPYVRHPEHERSLEERWLFEALWASYLPLLDAIERLADDGVAARFSLSVSPPLLSMLGDPFLRRRFEAHLDRIAAFAGRLSEHLAPWDPRAPALADAVTRLDASRRSWEACGGDVAARLGRLHREGHVELFTTAASHAYLPGLREPRLVAAQLEVGRRYLERVTGVEAGSMWLPECAIDELVATELARSGARRTVVDAHGIPPPHDVLAPFRTPEGVVVLARHPMSLERVWHHATGYPGAPEHRDFHCDAVDEAPELVDVDERLPDGRIPASGIKLRRVTGSPAKEPYAPGSAASLVRAQAIDFVRAARSAGLRTLDTRGRGAARRPGVVVAPFDAELFGHWWWEGPAFLVEVARAAAERRDVRLATLEEAAGAHESMAVASPITSTWGEGGFGHVWTGAATAHLLRSARGPNRAVLRAIDGLPEDALRGTTVEAWRLRAAAAAARQSLLLQASDWAFMIHTGDMPGYAQRRIAEHTANARDLASIALQEAELGAAAIDAITSSEARWPFLAELGPGEIVRALRA